jgi:hypothetical protein
MDKARIGQRLAGQTNTGWSGASTQWGAPVPPRPPTSRARGSTLRHSTFYYRLPCQGYTYPIVLATCCKGIDANPIAIMHSILERLNMVVLPYGKDVAVHFFKSNEQTLARDEPSFSIAAQL